MSKLTITITRETDDGEEETHELPARYAVCPRCEGHGTHLAPAIGEHAFTRDEFEEAFHDEEDRAAYFTRGGHYDVTCEACNGARVVAVLDAERATTAQRKLYDAHCAERAADEREARREARLGL